MKKELSNIDVLNIYKEYIPCECINEDNYVFTLNGLDFFDETIRLCKDNISYGWRSVTWPVKLLLHKLENITIEHKEELRKMFGYPDIAFIDAVIDYHFMGCSPSEEFLDTYERYGLLKVTDDSVVFLSDIKKYLIEKHYDCGSYHYDTLIGTKYAQEK